MNIPLRLSHTIKQYNLCEAIFINYSVLADKRRLRFDTCVYSSALWLLFCAVFALCLILFPEVCTNALRNALTLLFHDLIPSIFPFITLNALFSSSGGIESAARLLGRVFSRLFKTSGNLCAPFLIGLISGFPSGAESAAEVYMRSGCNKTEAERALAFCTNAGPAFVIAGLGGMLGDIGYGALIYVVQILSAFITARLFGSRSASDIPMPDIPRKGNASFVGSVTGSVIPMLNICAFVLIFSPIAALTDIGLSRLGAPAIIRGFALSLIELTNASAFITANLPMSLALPLCSFAVCWSGLCVHAQTSAAVADSRLSLKFYLAGKLFSAITAFLLTRIALILTSWC